MMMKVHTFFKLKLSLTPLCLQYGCFAPVLFYALLGSSRQLVGFRCRVSTALQACWCSEQESLGEGRGRHIDLMNQHPQTAG